MIEHSRNTAIQPYETITKRGAARPAKRQVQIRKVVAQSSCDACNGLSPVHKVCQKHFEELR